MFLLSRHTHEQGILRRAQQFSTTAILKVAHTGIPGTLGLGPQLPRRASDDDVPTWLPLQGFSWGKRGQKNTEYSGLT